MAIGNIPQARGVAAFFQKGFLAITTICGLAPVPVIAVQVKLKSDKSQYKEREGEYVRNNAAGPVCSASIRYVSTINTHTYACQYFRHYNNKFGSHKAIWGNSIMITSPVNSTRV